MTEFERHIVCEGMMNLRDIGGYPTVDGRKTKWRRLYRGAELSAVSQETAQQLLGNQLNIAYTIDFRGVMESEKKSYNFDSITRIHCPIEPGDMVAYISSIDHLTVEDAKRLLRELNEKFLKEYKESFAKYLRSLLDIIAKEESEKEAASASGVLFHCTAGKDRTGWAAGLLLALLGVPEEIILDDYMLTNKYFVVPADASKFFDKDKINDDALNVLWYVQREFLKRPFDIIAEKYGTVDKYATSELNITDEDIATFRRVYLE